MYRYRATQRGAVLVVGLVILLVMTLIGVTAMRATGLEEKMAGNMRDRNLAFQAAESGLRAGEAFLTIAVLPLFDGTNGLYQPTSVPPERWDAINWNASANVKSYTVGTLSSVASQPAYIIEELPPVPGTTGSLEAGVAEQQQFYRVTARGVGGTANAVVMLQSVFKR
jgi:type IV pilus assembly protein PilX